MVPANNRGIYPGWVNDKDIINQVLHEILVENGRLPYTYVINRSHAPETQERMKAILKRMQQEKLILSLTSSSEFIQIDFEGIRATQFGYHKYRRIKKWDILSRKLSPIYIILACLVVLALVSGSVYIIIHHVIRRG